MIFGDVPLDASRGGILAHNLKTADRVLRKGALIDDVAYDLLAEAGYAHVTIARLEPGDLPEGEAAALLGELILSPGLRRSADVHGRVNLFATGAGMFRLDADKVEQLNLVDEAITLATLPDRSLVAADDMVATLKIIPFAVSGDAMARAEAVIAEGGAALTLKPFRKLRAGLVLTKLPQLKDAAIAHTIAATAGRVAAHGGTLLPPLACSHATAPLTALIHELLAAGAALILISGASAVTDRKDVAPSAIIAAGGRITHFGMPVDPGNLICFGMIGETHAIVLPGCARSPKLNGIDWVLDRVFAGEAVTARDIARMGVGGLLVEAESRPTPRLTATAAGFGTAPKAAPRIAAIVLAAGRSARMGPDNKLLAPMPDGRPMIAQTVDHVLASTARPVIVVTGHQDAEIRAALSDRPVRFVHAEDFAEGLAASLHAGIAALSSGLGAALICLGDMPLIAPATLDRLIAAFDPTEGREIILPTFEGQRGNPVLWGKRFFPELLGLRGDSGARQILQHHMESVTEVALDTDSVLLDFDTPAALAALAAK